MAGVVVAVTLAHSAPTSDWFVDPITVKIPVTRQEAYDSSTKIVDIAGQRGECERIQVWSFDQAKSRTGVTVSFATLKGTSGAHTLPPSIWTYKQQGYVKTNGTTSYSCLHDIFEPDRKAACADTPAGLCLTGCPADPKGTCGGGKDPPGSCNTCNCNVQHTPCPSTVSFPCSKGWYPDPLLNVDAGGIPLIPPNFTQPIFIEVCIPYGATADNYTGSLTISSTASSSASSASSAASTAHHGGEIGDGSRNRSHPDASQLLPASLRAQTLTVPVRLEVWPIDLPHLNDSSAFNAVFRFGHGGMMDRWYPNSTPPERQWADWFPFLAHHRIPPDDIYVGQSPSAYGLTPTAAEFRARAASGSKWFNIMYAGQQPPLPHGYVNSTLGVIAPSVSSLTEMGLSERMYVYGFDEMDEKFNQTVFQIYGPIKSRFPAVKTAAVLNWKRIPTDAPLDIWINSYTDYCDYGPCPPYDQPSEKEKARQQWLSSRKGRQYWWYWCIGPPDPHQMNTFIERPAIEARLLFWLTALHAVNGMLYYDVAIWQDQCPKSAIAQRDCTPMRRINDTALTDFNPTTFPWNHLHDGTGANGEGSFTYPAEGGQPIGSIRLSNIADGIEDWQLFARLGATPSSISHGADLITQLVRGMSDFNLDGVRMEKVRRLAAQRVIEQMRQEKELVEGTEWGAAHSA